jgi:hypothetical protein
MKITDDLNVHLINDNQAKQVNGGGPIGVIALSFALSFAYDVISDWDANVEAFKRGYNS